MPLSEITGIVVSLVILILVYLLLFHGWKLVDEVPELVATFRSPKRKDLKLAWSPCGLVREEGSDIWDGFCHLASDDKGIYVSSWGIPNLYIPWSKLKVTGFKRLYLMNYQLLSIEGYPNITWCVSKKIRIPD